MSYTYLTKTLKTKHARRKLLYFVNRHDAESTQIGHNFRKKNVNSKNCPHFILEFRWLEFREWHTLIGSGFV